jgi:hypothetical protein
LRHLHSQWCHCFELINNYLQSFRDRWNTWNLWLSCMTRSFRAQKPLACSFEDDDEFWTRSEKNIIIYTFNSWINMHSALGKDRFKWLWTQKHLPPIDFVSRFIKRWEKNFKQIKSMNLNAKSMDKRGFEIIFWFKVIWIYPSALFPLLFPPMLDFS